MKIGIYGGTFDPPHLGHMASAQAAMVQLGLDRLLLIPAAIPPHKELPAGGAPGADRLAMTEIMADALGQAAGRPDCTEALDLELRRAGRSYTSDTLLELHAQYPDDELWLLLGSDMFFSLQDWHEPQKIMDLAGIAAFARREDDCGTRMELQAGALAERFGARVRILELSQVVEISSTQTRAALKGPGRAAEALLWPQVYGYILRRGLYGVDRELTRLTDGELRAASYSMVRAKRLPHIRGTEQAAVKLAERWGADPEYARRAAILHDCTKYYTMEEQLKLCDRYGIVLDDLERQAVKLLHAKTGAALAKHIFGQPDEVCRAIFWHTTGRADMTTLEKVLYLADYMEPTRDFPGVERLRALGETDLDAAVLMGFEMSIQEMADRGRLVHRNTLEARDWMLRT